MPLPAAFSSLLAVPATVFVARLARLVAVVAIVFQLRPGVFVQLRTAAVGTFAPLPAAFSLLLDMPATVFVAQLDLPVLAVAIVFQLRPGVVA